MALFTRVSVQDTHDKQRPFVLSTSGTYPLLRMLILPVVRCQRASKQGGICSQNQVFALFNKEKGRVFGESTDRGLRSFTSLTRDSLRLKSRVDASDCEEKWWSENPETEAGNGASTRAHPHTHTGSTHARAQASPSTV